MANLKIPNQASVQERSSGDTYETEALELSSDGCSLGSVTLGHVIMHLMPGLWFYEASLHALTRRMGFHCGLGGEYTSINNGQLRKLSYGCDNITQS